MRIYKLDSIIQYGCRDLRLVKDLIEVDPAFIIRYIIHWDRFTVDDKVSKALLKKTRGIDPWVDEIIEILKRKSLQVEELKRRGAKDSDFDPNYGNGMINSYKRQQEMRLKNRSSWRPNSSYYPLIDNDVERWMQTTGLDEISYWNCD